MRYNNNNNYNSKKDETQIKGLSVDVYNNDVNKALRKLKKKLQDDGLFQTLRDREYYTKPSEKRAKAKAAGRARWLKQQRKLQNDGIVPEYSKRNK